MSQRLSWIASSDPSADGICDFFVEPDERAPAGPFGDGSLPRAAAPGEISVAAGQTYHPTMTLHANVGTGPGPIAPDGCAVAFYTLLPPGGEAEIVHAAVPPTASVLELGCGTGRILRRLAELGHRVLGVDESPDMLDQAADLNVVCSRIQALDLHRAFDTVLLASTLINTADTAARTAMLDTARRHITHGGSFILQQHPPHWFDGLVPSSTERDGIRYTVGAIDRDGPLLATTVEYQIKHHRWTHTFTTRRLPDDELAMILASAGFSDIRWLTADHAWLAVAAA